MPPLPLHPIMLAYAIQTENVAISRCFPDIRRIKNQARRMSEPQLSVRSSTARALAHALFSGPGQPINRLG